ncbi:hypothetical protein EVAR_21262_1 [Eumeta japonica]|uniref:Uncharacterized protein n=1 Tax=Eumeta variegata TaxID=151549 RepID=A0A4C1WLI5_EUMVA|nr:hypothetical protein EVAR_21262_1 [Eumeta japonica]
MHRVRVRNRASVGDRRQACLQSGPYLCMRIDATRLFGAEIALGNRCNGDFGYRRVSPHPGLPLFTMRTLLSMTLLSRALQDDGWLATVSDAPLPPYFIGGASVAHWRFLWARASVPARPSLPSIAYESEVCGASPAVLPVPGLQLPRYRGHNVKNNDCSKFNVMLKFNCPRHCRALLRHLPRSGVQAQCRFT